MKKVTLEATESCREITVEFLELPDLVEIMKEHGEKVLDLVHSQILAHNFRGQHRATDKQGKLIKPVDHVYKFSDFIRGMTAGARSGEPSKEDVEMSKRLGKAIAARIAGGESEADVEAAVVDFHASLTAGWTYDESMASEENLAKYCRAYRLYKAAREKATTFR